MTLARRSPAPGTATGRPVLVPGLLLVVALLLVAANLRPAVTSLGSVLDEVRASVGASSGWASMVTALPPLCFGLAGLLAPLAARSWGLARAIGAAVLLLAVGLLGRVFAGAAVLLVGTFVACVGIAVCNVLIPVVIKDSYPHRIGLLTGLYTAVLQLTAALGSALTPPLDSALGGWRPALGGWGLLAVVALLGWPLAVRRSAAARPAPDPTAVPAAAPGTGSAPVARGWSQLGRSSMAWLVTVFFGLQSLFAYAVMGWLPDVLTATAGVGRGTAGAMVGLVNVLSVVVSLGVAPLAARQRAQSGWAAGLSAVGVLGLIGLLVAPAAAPWVWSMCLGLGMGAFALAVAFIGLRSGGTDETRRLSTMTQSIGYVLATLGPLLFGVLHGATGGWQASLWVLLAFAVVQVAVGVLVGRPRRV